MTTSDADKLMKKTFPFLNEDKSLPSDEVFASLVGLRETYISFKKWSSKDEKIFISIVDGVKDYKEYFKLQVELSFSTPIGSKFP